MEYMSILKKLLIYSEPKPYNQFELFEDESDEIKAKAKNRADEGKPSQGDNLSSTKTQDNESGSGNQQSNDAKNSKSDDNQSQSDPSQDTKSQDTESQDSESQDSKPQNEKADNNTQDPNAKEQEASGQEAKEKDTQGKDTHNKEQQNENASKKSKENNPADKSSESKSKENNANNTESNQSNNKESNPPNNADGKDKKEKNSDTKPISVEEWNRTRAPKESSDKGESGSDQTDAGSDKTGSGKKQEALPSESLPSDLKTNLKNIKEAFHSPTNQDLVIREFKVMQQCDAFIVYIDGMADKVTINDYLLRQMMTAQQVDDDTGACKIDFIMNNLLSVNQATLQTEFTAIIKQILNGLTAIFVDGETKCIVVESRGYASRNVAPPLTESVIQGPQEGFVENLRTNLTLVRKIIKSKDLITEIVPIGKVEQINCAIVYMQEIANPKVVEEVKRRINNLDIDFAIGGGVLDQLIEDHPLSLFPQIVNTERPDRTASLLMDGQVALICDGTPFASVVPVTFFHLFHTSEDSTLRWQYGTFIRYIRVIAGFFATFLPGLYIALTLYHKEMIPNELLTSLHKAKENVPFPTLIELLLMEISFEIIREAGVRVPGVIGQTLGIIGAIVLGQAAVSAGLVSPVLIIIVAITGLGSFAISNYSLSFAVRITRFIFIFLGAIAGFYGITAGLYVMAGIACSMKSFGVPYFSPIAPKTKSSPDVINKGPSWKQTERPDFINPINRQRGGNPVRQWAEEKDGEKKA